MQLTLFGQRVRNIKVVIIEVKQLHCSIQSKLCLVDLLWHSIYRNLNSHQINAI